MNRPTKNSTELPLLKYRGYIGILKYGKKDHRIYGSVVKEVEPQKISKCCFAGDNLSEAEKNFQDWVSTTISIHEYELRNDHWKQTVDSESISAVYNILPEVFLERINKGDFDENLLDATVGGEYEVPLYYVTKAWD